MMMSCGCGGCGKVAGATVVRQFLPFVVLGQLATDQNYQKRLVQLVNSGGMYDDVTVQLEVEERVNVRDKYIQPTLVAKEKKRGGQVQGFPKFLSGGDFRCFETNM
jgi:hypothetical protein